MKRIRIAVVTTGRFHVLDLARELAALGQTVSFYSILPASRAGRCGLARGCDRSLLVFVFPLVALQYLFPKFLPDFVDQLLRRAVDFVTAIKLLGMQFDQILCLETLEPARTSSAGPARGNAS